jgi:hypothetical protein
MLYGVWLGTEASGIEGDCTAGDFAMCMASLANVPASGNHFEQHGMRGVKADHNDGIAATEDLALLDLSCTWTLNVDTWDLTERNWATAVGPFGAIDSW